MYYELSEEKIRSRCRTAIENMEKWARLIIDKELTELYGKDFFYSKDNYNNPIVKKEIIKKAEKIKADNPERFSRMVDTLFLDEIIYFLCKDSLYKNCFKKILDLIYPDGKMEAMTYLSRIIPIRNKLSHSNPISIREAEKAICYSNDFVDGVKEYMKHSGQQQQYNVPNIIKINDSLGNEFYLNKNKNFELINIKDKDGNLHEFEIGERYIVRLTLDPSFKSEEYKFRWSIENGYRLIPDNLDYLDIVFNDKLVGENQAIYCTLTSNKSWHRYRRYDQQFAIMFKVLPPKN